MFVTISSTQGKGWLQQNSNIITLSFVTITERIMAAKKTSNFLESSVGKCLEFMSGLLEKQNDATQ